jgi:hypothetical protein
MRWGIIALGLWIAAVSAADPAQLNLQHRWVYVQTNLQVDGNVETTLAVLERAAKAGYNGLVLADSKFMRWDAWSS